MFFIVFLIFSHKRHFFRIPHEKISFLIKNTCKNAEWLKSFRFWIQSDVILRHQNEKDNHQTSRLIQCPSLPSVTMDSLTNYNFTMKHCRQLDLINKMTAKGRWKILYVFTSKYDIIFGLVNRDRHKRSNADCCYHIILVSYLNVMPNYALIDCFGELCFIYWEKMLNAYKLFQVTIQFNLIKMILSVFPSDLKDL